ncbi:MAG: PQQ-dependent dehydrogenase, methanol/ethanol family [Pseudomonadales bacterium]|nr:PQQ-dependent dehydrogenase, methanol/ethanol family [Pseudomonadales bacterium]
MPKIITIILALAAAAGIYLYFESQSDTLEDAAVETRTSDSHTDESKSSNYSSTIGMIDEARINNADSEPGNWLAHGRTYEEQRFSPLTQINQTSIQKLGLAWYKDMGTNRALESTPIVVDGIMFFTSAWSRVHAIDAETGKNIWSYDPKVPGEWGRRACCDVVNRGVAVYKGKVYVASLDGRLIALDAATGKEVWVTDTLIDRERFYTITGAPRVANNKVFIGNGGAEFGVRGYVTAYDSETGKQVWRFFTVPGDPAQPFEHPELAAAAKTWKGGEWWKIGGGGTVWNSIVYDPDFNQVYLGVGNGSPWTRAIRSPGGGDNLFLSSIVALNADTGVMNWYYQTTPGDSWDYTAVQDMTLADMEVDGVQRKVLLQAPKNGFFYVIDRADGELLRAHKYVSANWATHVDMQTGRPVEDPALDYTDKPKWILPGPIGGHNWQAMAFDESSGIVYIPAQEAPFIYGANKEWQKTGLYKHVPGGWNTGLDFGSIGQTITDNMADQPPVGGILKAFDPLSGEDLWTIKHAHYWNGGVLATAGKLVFQGDALGNLSAYNSGTGELLWQFNTYSSILAPPISYQINGTQYLSVLTGSGGGELFTGYVESMASAKYGNYGKLLVFKIDGKNTLPEPTVWDRSIPEQPAIPSSSEDIARGEQMYNEICAVCHGLFVKSSATIPDLRLMNKAMHAIFNEIVLEGVKSAGGMASFADLLSPPDVEKIHAYIINQANIDRQAALDNK